MKLTDLADACRKSGLKVVEIDGWRNRGHGSFVAVESVICHHTAGPASGNMPSLGVITHGRAGLAGPLCNLGLGRDGTVYVIAAGYGWHAGVVAKTAYTNSHAIGIEAEATGVSKWPAAQMDAYARLCKALCDHYNVPVSRVLGHKEVATPRGRKIDPNFSMSDFRARVSTVSTDKKDWFDMATEADLKKLIAANNDEIAALVAKKILATELDDRDATGKVTGKATVKQQLERIETYLQRADEHTKAEGGATPGK